MKLENSSLNRQLTNESRVVLDVPAGPSFDREFNHLMSGRPDLAAAGVKAEGGRVSMQYGPPDFVRSVDAVIGTALFGLKHDQQIQEQLDAAQRVRDQAAIKKLDEG